VESFYQGLPALEERVAPGHDRGQKAPLHDQLCGEERCRYCLRACRKFSPIIEELISASLDIQTPQSINAALRKFRRSSMASSGQSLDSAKWEGRLAGTDRSKKLSHSDIVLTTPPQNATQENPLSGYWSLDPGDGGIRIVGQNP
jgi:hypothetical protein